MQPHPFPVETIIRAKNLSKIVYLYAWRQWLSYRLLVVGGNCQAGHYLKTDATNKCSPKTFTRKASRKILVCSGAGYPWNPATVTAVFYQQVRNTYDYRLSERTEPLFKPPRVTHSLVNYQVHLSPTLERKIRRGSMLMRNERTYLC